MSYLYPSSLSFRFIIWLHRLKGVPNITNEEIVALKNERLCHHCNLANVLKKGFLIAWCLHLKSRAWPHPATPLTQTTFNACAEFKSLFCDFLRRRWGLVVHWDLLLRCSNPTKKHCLLTIREAMTSSIPYSLTLSQFWSRTTTMRAKVRFPASFVLRALCFTLINYPNSGERRECAGNKTGVW